MRHLRRDWFQTGLLLLILGLGVGTFLSIRMANRAAVDGFKLFTDSLRGTSDWIIESSGNGIALAELQQIRNALEGVPADLFPVMERSLFPLLDSGEPSEPIPQAVKLLGLDLVQLRSIASPGEDTSADAFWGMLDNPRHLLVSADIADQWQVTEGSVIDTAVDGVKETVEITGILPRFRDQIPLPRNLVVADLKALLARMDESTIDRVEVVIPPGNMRDQFIEETRARLEASLGDRYLISSPRDKRMDGETMTSAFRLNLTVLSLVALLVGVFLIAQTLDATVSR